jgi:hypothetical protein
MSGGFARALTKGDRTPRATVLRQASNRGTTRQAYRVEQSRKKRRSNTDRVATASRMN